jgi:diguanylate cyclase (GGDEF)-like protein
MDTPATVRWSDLLRASRSWGAVRNLDELFTRIVTDCAQLSGMETTAIFLIEDSGLRQRASCPAFTTPDTLSNIPNQVVSTGRSIFGHNLDGIPTQKAVYCAPLTASRGILGAIYMETSKDGVALETDLVEYFDAIALQSANVIEHANLYHSAITDSLTGLFTHRHFQHEVEQAVRRSRRSELPFSLLLLDLDHFKQLNDTCGHAIGNSCLLQVAEILKSTLRSTDIIARFGGDEFEVLLPETSADAAVVVADKLRDQVSKLAFDVRISSSIGVASFPVNAMDAGVLFIRADEALYLAKAAGRNRISVSMHLEEKIAPFNRPTSTNSRFSRDSARNGRTSEHSNQPETIDGHELIRRLGEGANGEVFLVNQPDLQRQVALKRPLSVHSSPEQSQAFELEARITASLTHPGVITVHTMGRDSDGRRYYTMKPLDGVALSDIIKKRNADDIEIKRAYPLTRLLEILQRTCETIAFAHERKVAHLDLNPSNLIIGNFGEVTVIDWGSGAGSSLNNVDQSLNGDYELAIVAGSLRYLAPEQIPASGDRPGVESDVFSIGTILYEILTGSPPFLGRNLKESVGLLLNSTPISPNRVVLDDVVDPGLSSLCLSALSRDKAARPSARTFAEKLGRFVRGEPEWIISKYSSETPVQSTEWHCKCGHFDFQDGEFIVRRNTDPESVLLWNVPVQGSFRFVVEAMLENNHAELAILGGAHLEKPFDHGYIFHAAGENNSVCKLSRGGRSIAATRDFPIIAGVRYTLEIEYQESEGWLYCYLDGKKVFSYRELFGFRGNYLGIYACGEGSHIRPLEIHRQVWGRHVLAIKAADAFYCKEQFEYASEQYKILSERAGDSLEGEEARLKMAMCFAKVRNYQEAEKIFESIFGSAMEPYALAELAAMCLLEKYNLEHGVELIERLLKKFPASHAKWRINEISDQFGLVQYQPPLEQWVKLQVRVASAASRLLSISTFSQTLHRTNLNKYKMKLGCWTEALDESQNLVADLSVRQQEYAWHSITVAALANGRDDLLVYDPRQLLISDPFGFEWSSGLTLHVVARLNKMREFIEYWEDARPSFSDSENLQPFVDLLQISLAVDDVDAASRYLEQLIESKFAKGSWFRLAAGTCLVECDNDDLLSYYLKDVMIDTPEFSLEAASIRALKFMNNGDFIAAAGLLKSCRPTRAHQDTTFIRQILLGSLGYNVIDDQENIMKAAANHFAGTEKDLVEIFTGQKDITSVRWPYPNWRPEWRLWLALWLEAKDRKTEAFQVASAALDPRYGRSHSQCALRRLVDRLAVK